MWIQIIKARLKPGAESQLTAVMAELEAIEQPDSGLVRSVLGRSRQDPLDAYLIVTFQSEASARARESDPRREPGLERVRTMMAQTFEGQPEFIDLDVVAGYGK